MSICSSDFVGEFKYCRSFLGVSCLYSPPPPPVVCIPPLIRSRHEHSSMVLLEYLLASLVGVHTVSGYVTAWPSSSDPRQISLGTALEHPDHSSPIPTNEQLESWIAQQRKTSWKYLLDNIAPRGLNAARAAAGTVIASPSKSYPNYFYQWVRDAAITMKGVVGEYEKTKDADLRNVIEQYVKIQGTIQAKANPSGGYYSGGLGEPKFMIDGEPFTL